MKNAVNERLGIFIDHLKITNVDFGDSIGETKQAVGNWLKDVKIPVTSLGDILRIYPQLNARWLLTGEGQMLEEERKATTEESGPAYTTKIELMQKVMELQEKYVTTIERENEDLRKAAEPKKEKLSETGT